MKKLLARVGLSPGLGVSTQQLLGSGAPGPVVFWVFGSDGFFLLRIHGG